MSSSSVAVNPTPVLPPSTTPQWIVVLALQRGMVFLQWVSVVMLYARHCSKGVVKATLVCIEEVHEVIVLYYIIVTVRRFPYVSLVIRTPQLSEHQT